MSGYFSKIFERAMYSFSEYTDPLGLFGEFIITSLVFLVIEFSSWLGVILKSDEIESIVLYQVSALKGIIETYGVKLNHVKPHGALYNMATIDDNIAEVIVLAIKKIDPNLKLYGPSKMNWKKISEKHGIKYVSEVFSDRNYNEDLTLVDRKNENSMITRVENSIEHISRMLYEGKVKTITNKLVDIDVETICIHGDQPNAPIFAKKIFNKFQSNIKKW